MPCHSERGAHSCSSSPRNLGSTRISFWKRERERERESQQNGPRERGGRRRTHLATSPRIMSFLFCFARSSRYSSSKFLSFQPRIGYFDGA